MSHVNHNNQKKIAVINDLSGFGRCSLTVSMPIISYMGIQVCPVPTSVFSNHTGFEHYFFDDYTEHMEAYVAQWQRLGLKFEGITSGFLGSKRQIEMVIGFIEAFRSKRTIVVVDPVMGDDGMIYATYTEELCREMKRLTAYADILTPNLTECCKLTDTPYKAEGWNEDELYQMAQKLLDQGPGKVVITGIPQEEYIVSYVAERGRPFRFVHTYRVGTQRCGTGDVFASIIAADAVNGVDFEHSVQKASDFVRECMIKSMEMEIPVTDGVCFEEILYTLKRD